MSPPPERPFQPGRFARQLFGRHWTLLLVIMLSMGVYSAFMAARLGAVGLIVDVALHQMRTKQEMRAKQAADPAVVPDVPKGKILAGFEGGWRKWTGAEPPTARLEEPSRFHRFLAGFAAAGLRAEAEVLLARRASWHHFRAALARAFALRPELKSLAADDTLMCRCEDVTLGRMRPFRDWRDAKLHSRCGMGPCQGRVCGAAAKVILGWGMSSVRPPVLPARVESLISETQQEGKL